MKLQLNETVCASSQDRVVIAMAYDCVEKMVYWSDITGPAISRASLSGGDIIPVVTTGTTNITSPVQLSHTQYLKYFHICS